MICKKCGATIEDNSKFCGYCGNPAEVVNNNETDNMDSINEVDLGKTITVDPIKPNTESNVQMPFDTPGMQNDLNQQKPINNGGAMPNSTQTNGNKNNKLFLIIGGAVLAVVAIALVVLAFMKSSDNPVSVLEKAISNLGNQGEKSATIDTTVSLAAPTGESFTFSATTKAEIGNDNSTKLQMTLNKSLLFEEMNVYASVDQKNAILYLESSLVDMLGMTSSLNPSWLYFRLPLDEFDIQQNEELDMPEIKLEDLIDEEHFKYIDQKDGLKHYVLTIDQKLINNMKAKLESINDKSVEEALESLDSMEEIEETIKLDFYITTSDELSKIELDMSDYLGEENVTFSQFKISISFRDLGKTTIDIPKDAEDSTIDLETYILNNSLDSGLGSDLGFDTDYGFDTEFDFNSDYDYTMDTDFGDLGFEF